MASPNSTTPFCHNKNVTDRQTTDDTLYHRMVGHKSNDKIKGFVQKRHAFRKKINALHCLLGMDKPVPGA